MKGHIAKKGNRYYPVISIYDASGKRKLKWLEGFSRKTDAQKRLNEALNDVQKGIFVEPSKITINEFLEYFLKHYVEPSTSPRTFEGYESIIRKHLAPAFQNLTLDKLKPLHLQKYYNEKAKEGLSARTILHHHRLIHKALKQAVIWEFAVRNAAEAVTPPKPIKYEAKTYTSEQINTLYREAKNTQYYEVIFVGTRTGMRQGEILGLLWQNVDLEKKQIFVRSTLQRVVGKGLILKEVPKTKSSRRTIKISDSVCDVLKKIRIKQAENKLKWGPEYHDGGYVFTQENGKPFEPSELRRVYKNTLEKAGLPHIRFHDLRHTYATLLLEEGVPLKTVQEILGHSTMWITGDIYSHVTPTMQEEAIDTLERILASNKPSNKLDRNQ